MTGLTGRDMNHIISCFIPHQVTPLKVQTIVNITGNNITYIHMSDTDMTFDYHEACITVVHLKHSKERKGWKL